MNKKRITILIVLSALLVIVFISTYSYALFENNISGEVETDIAKWKIKVNNSLITDGTSETFVIDTINYTQTDSNVRSGKFAPGIEGYYDLEIDPSNTEVSVKYNIIVDNFETNNLEVSRVELLTQNAGTLTVDGNTYTGIIPLNNKKIHKIRMYITWTDYNTEETNAEDSIIGTRDNPDVHIPVTVNLIQYLGE